MQKPINEFDTVAVEARARQLQAEALAYGVRQVRNWLRGNR